MISQTTNDLFQRFTVEKFCRYIKTRHLTRDDFEDLCSLEEETIAQRNEYKISCFYSKYGLIRYLDEGVKYTYKRLLRALEEHFDMATLSVVTTMYGYGSKKVPLSNLFTLKNLERYCRTKDHVLNSLRYKDDWVSLEPGESVTFFGDLVVTYDDVHTVYEVEESLETEVGEWRFDWFELCPDPKVREQVFGDILEGGSKQVRDWFFDELEIYDEAMIFDLEAPDHPLDGVDTRLFMHRAVKSGDLETVKRLDAHLD